MEGFMTKKLLSRWPAIAALPFFLLAACDRADEVTETPEMMAEAAGTTIPGPFGLPPVPVPADNPMSEAKVMLGEALFNDTRLSTTGEVSCATCHDPAKAFTDSPRNVSEGIEGLTGTRNAPTVVNAAYMKTQFWDGREPDLEGQSKGPLVNPVEMGQPDHEAVLEIIRADDGYGAQFRDVFGVEPEDITIDHFALAVAAFERTVVFGNSPFDRWYFGGEEDAISEDAKRGFAVYLGQGRCVSCHTISQNYATFSDSKFHNLNVNFGRIASAVTDLTTAFEERRAAGEDIDTMVLTDVDISELGRFAVTGVLSDVVIATPVYVIPATVETTRGVDTGGSTGGLSPSTIVNSYGVETFPIASTERTYTEYVPDPKRRSIAYVFLRRRMG